MLSSAVSEDRKEYELRVLKTRNWDYTGSIKNICQALVVKELQQTEDQDEGAADDDGDMMNIGRGGGGSQRIMYDRLSSVLNFAEEVS